MKSVIYKPKGKALEYAELACNLYDGCTHGCTYCYVPDSPVCRTKNISRADFYASAKPRANILERMEADAKKIRGCPTPILFSFTSDAYQPCEKEFKVMRGALEICKMYDLTPNILTKSGFWGIERDIDLLKTTNASWGVTLTHYNNEGFIRHREPSASDPTIRIYSLNYARKNGLKTWISLEPLIDFNEAGIIIEKTHSFTDLYKVGKLNHQTWGKQMDWGIMLGYIETKLNEFNCKYIIKQSLEAYRDK